MLPVYANVIWQRCCRVLRVIDNMILCVILTSYGETRPLTTTQTSRHPDTQHLRHTGSQSHSVYGQLSSFK